MNIRVSPSLQFSRTAAHDQLQLSHLGLYLSLADKPLRINQHKKTASILG